MLVRIFDKNHPDLTTFRQKAIEECGGHVSHLTLTGSYSNITTLLKEYGAHRIEDIYRFTDEKWNRTGFDFIDAHYSNGVITNIAGAKQYGLWMRGAIYHFGLREYSKKHPSVLFQPNGQLDSLIKYASEKKLNGIFISIYPHESRLKALSRALKSGSGISTTGDINLIRKLTYRGTYCFNDVNQDFFVIELTDKKFDISQILI